MRELGERPTSETTMTKREIRKEGSFIDGFGERLARLRKQAGLTQSELAKKIGATQRMITHYETRRGIAPASILPPLAKALGVSVDKLLGVKQAKGDAPKNLQLWKKLRQIEQLKPNERRTIMKVLDSFLKQHIA